MQKDDGLYRSTNHSFSRSTLVNDAAINIAIQRYNPNRGQSSNEELQ